MSNGAEKLIKGINVCNPVDVEKEYLLHAVEYARKHGFNHIQINGPIHDAVKGNIDGMTPWRKYRQFNDEKNTDYVETSLDAVNAACEKASACGIKMYVWHHELELPAAFKTAFPEILNSYGDIEITHPLVCDFLENKIADFFFSYPKMDGIILTLHETRVPLLKLKDQKLSDAERVKYITRILFEACERLGKELIVRPFASIEKDYEIMTKAYEEISENLLIMDKWTQFDWSLTAPSNMFFNKIKKNPLLIEADIYGEFFGMGYFPLMLKNHLRDKFAYCRRFSPVGYVSRIDRAGKHCFGDVNEVNIAVTNAYLNGEDADAAIDDFFGSRYPEAASEMKALMEKTEDIVIKTIYIGGFYFNSQSFFPSLNHCKNHYYFEIMRSSCDIDSNEWFVPRNYKRGSLEALIKEKESAVISAEKLYNDFERLRGRLNSEDYEKLRCKFFNLKSAAQIWAILLRVLMAYVKYFETRSEKYINIFEEELDKLADKKNEGIKLLGDKYFCLKNAEPAAQNLAHDYVGDFAEEIKQSFFREKEETEKIESEGGLLDYVICAGATEGHRLQKEVNFSDTLITENGLCRLAGSSRGAQWCTVNAHGWFSYFIRIKPNDKNIIKVTAGSLGAETEIGVSVGNERYTVCEKTNDIKEFVFEYAEKEGKDTARIRFDKISGSTPCVYTIKVYG